MSAAGIAAVNWVAVTYVVARSAPFQRTTELGTRFVPVTVSVNPGPPAAAVDGLRLVAVGTGLEGDRLGQEKVSRTSLAGCRFAKPTAPAVVGGESGSAA